MNKRQTGNLGERIAENYFKNKGYQILDRNYSLRIPGSPKRLQPSRHPPTKGRLLGEIDIIAKKDETTSFVEVKTLAENYRGSTAERSEAGDEQSSATPVILPEEKVNFAKQRKLVRTAESWLMEKKIPLGSKWQIDVLAIKIDLNSKKAKIRHFKNVVGFDY